MNVQIRMSASHGLLLVCSSQFGNIPRILGYYELEEDAARVYDKVARILGDRDLNFPNPEDIVGPRSKGADRLAAVAIEAAKNFVETDRNNHASFETKLAVLMRGDSMTSRCFPVPLPKP